MFYCILPLLAALFLSITSAVFSITGLVAIFSASKIAIIIMGASLEFAKIVTAAWSHRYWHSPHFPKLMKSYMVAAIVVLLLITSTGIFGFLAKSHTELTTSSNQVQIKIERNNQQINSEQNIIDRATKQLNSLDKSLDVYFSKDKATTALKARKQQAEERKELTQTVADSQKKIDTLRDELLSLQSTTIEQDQHLGPIKYIAELIYTNPQENMDTAVRIIILMVIFVFDPLALLLIIASNISWKIRSESKINLINKETPDIITKIEDDLKYFKNNTESIQNNIQETSQIKDETINKVEQNTEKEDKPFVPKEIFSKGISKIRHWGYGKPETHKDEN